eukprot:g19057.t1
MTDTSKRDAAKESLVQRYKAVAGNWALPLGSCESLYEFLAASLDNFKTAPSCVKEVMGTPLCVMCEEEKEQMRKTLTRSNLYKSIRARCVCAELRANNISRKYCICFCKDKLGLLSCQHDAYAIACRVFKHVEKIGHPSFEDYKKSVKVIKNKELWIIGRDMADNPATRRGDPSRLVITLATTIATVGAEPLITRAQWDDWLSKLITAKMELGAECACQLMGEVLRDLQAVNVEVAATTYRQRLATWMTVEFEDKWKTCERRAQAIYREKEQLKKGSCRFQNCRLWHPASATEFSEEQFNAVCRDHPHLHSLSYGTWWNNASQTTSAPATPAPEKKDE